MTPETTDVILASVALLVAVSAVAIGMQPGGRRQGLAFLAAWLVPGLGHVLVGKPKKALFFALALGATYVFGLWLSGWRAVSFADNPFYHVGQYGSGLTSLLGVLLGDPKAFPRDDMPKSWFDPGLLYVCAAGLLNLVVTLNILDIRPPAPRDPAPRAPTPEVPA